MVDERVGGRRSDLALSEEDVSFPGDAGRADVEVGRGRAAVFEPHVVGDHDVREHGLELVRGEEPTGAGTPSAVSTASGGCEMRDAGTYQACLPCPNARNSGAVETIWCLAASPSPSRMSENRHGSNTSAFV